MLGPARERDSEPGGDDQELATEASESALGARAASGLEVGGKTGVRFATQLDLDDVLAKVLAEPAPALAQTGRRGPARESDPEPGGDDQELATEASKGAEGVRAACDLKVGGETDGGGAGPERDFSSRS